MKSLEKTIQAIGPIDTRKKEKARRYLDTLTKPQGSLGRLEELAQQLVGITREDFPALKHKVIFTLAADHGIAASGVSAFPQAVTAQMVYNFLRGGAGINVLARQVKARVIVVDMGVAEKIKYKKEKIKNFYDRKIGYGTKNFVKEPAMTREEARRSLETGIEVFTKEYFRGLDVVGIGEMGIGNTSASSAITAVFTRQSVGAVTGRGTGIDEEQRKNKIRLIEQSLALHHPSADDPLDVLSKIGGYEIGGLAGILLAAAAHRVPAVIDGFISGAAALISYHLAPAVKEYLIAAYCSVERGHTAILEHLGLDPLLDLQLRLGEGTGAALAMNILDASQKILSEMATFKSANVSEKIG